MKIQEAQMQVITTDTGAKVSLVGAYSKLLPISVQEGVILPSELGFKCIATGIDWTGFGRKKIYVVEQLFPVWLFWWIIYRLERTWEHLIIAFVLLLQIWQLADVPNFEKPSIKHITLKSNQR